MRPLESDINFCTYKITYTIIYKIIYKINTFQKNHSKNANSKRTVIHAHSRIRRKRHLNFRKKMFFKFFEKN